MAEIDDCLMVKVLEARNIMTPAFGVPQAYAKVQVGSGAAESTEAADPGNNPVWEATTLVFTGIVNSGVDNMRVLIRAKDPVKMTEYKLGMVPIDLADVLHSPYLEIDEWYPIVREIGMGQAPSGEVRLQFTYYLQRDETLGKSDEEGVRSPTSRQVKKPNLVTVNVVRARGLRLERGDETLDPIAVVEICDMRKETKVAKRTNAPKWDTSFAFNVTKEDAFVEVSIMSVGYISRTLVGRVRVPLVEVASAGTEGFRRLCPLMDEDYQVFREPRGEVELAINWVYDAEATSKSGFFQWATLKKKKVSKLEQEVSGLMAQTETDELIVRKQRRTKDQQEAYDAASKARLDAARGEVQALQLMGPDDVREGDYQVQVHVIEARDLAAVDLGGTSDPSVYVYIMGQKKRTRIIPKTTSCVFDETLYFNFKDVTKEEFEKAVIKVTCFDANSFSRWCVIGQYQNDLKWVYSQGGHEYYRKWVALYNTKRKDAGVQGYLRISITVLGPGDTQAQHNLADEIEAEMAEEDQEGGPGGQIMSGPNVVQELVFVVLSVFRAEELPMLDTMTFMGGAGIDAFVQLEMGGSEPCRSSVVTARGKGDLSPAFYEELWMPVMDPPASNRIALSLWDKNYTTRHTLLGYAYFDYRKLRRKTTPEASGGVMGALLSSEPQPFAPPFWVNFYGAPVELRGGRPAEFVGTYPEFASTYRGRLLVSMHVATRPKPSEEARPHSKRLRYELPAFALPETALYTLRLHLIYGSEIPVFQGVTGAAKMGVRVLLGRHVLTYSCRANKKGVVLWDELREARSLLLPKDLTQLPDIVLQLFKYPEGTGPCVSFARCKAVEVLANQFGQEPQWQELRADRTREGSFSGLGEDDHPGALLIKMGLGLDEDAQEQPWSDELDMLRDRSPHVLRVHVYQARNLPSISSDGLLDPYVKIRFAGLKKKTKAQRSTTAPLFYETLEFHEMLPNDLRFAPEVVLQVWDKDVLGNTPVGILRRPFKDVTATRNDRSAPPTPRWFPLSDANGRPGSGEILVSFQYFKKADPSADVEPPPEIAPRMRVAWIEITLIGLRDLKKYGFNAIRDPYVRFHVPASGNNSVVTHCSKSPSPKDPNYLKTYTMAVELPENAAFAPPLDIRVYDRRLGLSHPLIGATSVRLDTKLPWNSEEYVPPLTMEFKKGRDFIDEQDEDESTHPTDRESDDEDEEEEEAKEAEDGGEGEGEGGEGEGARRRARGEGADPRQLEDPGTGVFLFDQDIELGMVKEDVEYEEQQRRRAEERRKGKGRGSKGGQPGSLLDAATLALARSDKGDKLSELPIDFPHGWASSDFIEDRDGLLKDRRYRVKELEEVLKTAPFEAYPLYRGATRGGGSMIFGDASLRRVGVLKGIIRVCVTDPRYDKSPFVDMRPLAKATPCLVRLYVVKAEHLQPTDSNGSADPYLVAKLGKQRLTNRDMHRVKTLEPDFYECFEFQASLPGPSQLKLQVFDWDRFMQDELIGETIIDLEDRFFHPKWQEWGVTAKRAKEVGPVKPLENRDLWVQRSRNPQGQVQLWADVLTVKEARRYQKEVLAGPPELKVEVRVVCWKSRNVRGKGVSPITDMYTQFWMEGQGKRQETDTHWRCKNGSGSWNYRVKFPVTLPMKPEYARLRFQVWDRDILFNDVIAEGSIDLYKWFLLVYHRKASVRPFKEIKDGKKRKQLEALAGVQGEGAGRSFASIPEIVVMGAGGRDKQGVGEGKAEADSGFRPYEYDDLGGEDEEDDDKDDDRDDEHTALLTRASGGVEEEGEQAVGLEEEAGKGSEDDAKDLLNQLKTYLGIGEIADDAEWVRLSYHDHGKGVVYERGELAMSIEIVPWDEADTRKVGFGRDEPNTNPYLPPPVGRMQFSFNPFLMLKELLGPEMLCKILCCCCVMLAAVLLVVAGTYMSGLVSILEVLQGKV